jgi:hypothetical protein
MVFGLTPGELGTVTTALVGAAGLAANGLMRRGDRKHEAKQRQRANEDAWEDARRVHRDDAYVDALAFAERLHQQVVSQLARRHETTPDPLPTENWLLLLARLNAYGSDTVRDVFAVLAEARSDFERATADALGYQERARELRSRLDAPLVATPPSVKDLLEGLRKAGGGTEVRAYMQGVPDGDERARLEVQHADAIHGRRQSAEAAHATFDAITAGVAELRRVIREEIR